MTKRAPAALSLIARVLFAIYLSLCCYAGVVLAFVITVAALRLTPNDLQAPASASFMVMFMGLVLVLITAMALVGYGLAVFVLHRFSAEGVLDFLDLRDEDTGPWSRISRWVHRTAAQLGVPSDV